MIIKNRLTVLLILFTTLLSCSKDSDSSSASAASSTTTATGGALSGTYTGEIKEIYTNGTGTVIFRDTIENQVFTVSG